MGVDPARMRATDRLQQRLADVGASLDAAFQAARGAAGEGSTLEPAAEWLLDHFYVIKEQIKEIRAGLPRGYWNKLPTCTAPDGGREPVVLRVMRRMLDVTDTGVRVRDVRRHVAAYQDRHTPFTLGELWAMPLMLRLALLERLRPLADALVRRLDDTERAGEWAERILAQARDRPADLVLGVADMARAQPTLSPAWVSEFQRRLHGGHASLGLALAWLEQQLAARHTHVADAIERDNRDLAAAQVTISSCIRSMHLIRRYDWSRVVEGLSRVERHLRDDPAGVYADMDFATRDHYRHAVEALAKHASLAEWDVAARAVAMAANAAHGRDPARRRHVGYWLIGLGRRALEQDLGAHHSLSERWIRVRQRYPLFDYVGSILLLTFGLALYGTPGLDEFAPLNTAVMAVALIIAASHVAVSLVNWLATLWVPPERLPRMAFEHGIPQSLRTLVAVPCLLGSDAETEELVAALEVRQLVNRDDNLYFALLADLPDASACESPEDAARIRTAVNAIKALNERHGGRETARFGLFLRRRQWNPGEKVWMGRERKRGKIADLNRYLRGDDEAMQLIVGRAEHLRACRYVIVLDADSELPPEAAQRLVATMAHPLNQPRFDAGRRCVVEGYGVLQPRISVGLAAESASTYARLFGGQIGLDPYTHLVSDVYQDLFGEASFVGKGIYDIDAFVAATDEHFPDNLILSHDLLEGSYARTGLVSDVELFERQPDRYVTDMRRRHRWIRGDWQILPWLLPWAPGPGNRWQRNALDAYQRWKILDNLRRSLVPLAMLVLLVDGWLISAQPLYWTAVVLIVAFASPLLISFRHLFKRNRRMEWRVHLRLQREGTRQRLQQTLLFVIMLPYEAAHHVDAIVRSLWRMFISRRRLLQWTPADAFSRQPQLSVRGYYRVMWPAVVLAVVLVLALALLGRDGASWFSALPLLVLWALSPWIARDISRPRRPRDVASLGADDRAFLGGVARRTWRFFEQFVNAESRHLPPDNHQQFPAGLTARRTSPTNIGMYLTSAMTAWDFGYITVPDLLARIENTLDTLERMARHRGHFFNWYDIDTLQPLPPRYVSTVDSGNLVVCLLMLARGLDMLAESRVLPATVWRGLTETWQVCREARTGTDEAAAAVDTLLAARPAGLSATRSVLPALWQHAQQCTFGESEVDGRYWCDAFIAQVRAWSRELDVLAPASAQDEIDRDVADEPFWWQVSEQAAGRAEIASRLSRARALAARCRALGDVEFGFLYRPRQGLLAIGYDADHHALDAGSYDLLASESQLTVFAAIAQGKLPGKSWFSLGRLLTLAAGQPALVSWSGSMFEYLMPLLFMPRFGNTLLDRSVRAVVARQIAFGREQGVPWGISESGYNITDADMVYQYRAFGVPGLGLKRRLGDDLVVAPYACALAAMIDPVAAARNLRELKRLDALDRFGYYEALDYTATRVPEDAEFAIVRSHMAHHQGMTLLALSAVLNGGPMQRRFMREPMFRANQILLQEKVPAVLAIDADTLRREDTPRATMPTDAASVIRRLDTTVPQLQLLSNGRYHVVVSQTGAGYSQFDELAINPWRGDGVRDGEGIFCYVQDLDSGHLWSNTWQPVVGGDDYRATFGQANAEFLRSDHGIQTHTRMAVSAEDDVEMRRITVTNQSGTRRRLVLCSYLEWGLAPQRDIAAHPAFNKLFVQTEYIAASQALLARRRPRSATESPPVFMHLFTASTGDMPEPDFETRRDVFIGRGGTPGRPQALLAGAALANGVGVVLDPIAAVRREVALEPGQSISFDLVVGVGADRDETVALAERYADGRMGTRVFDLAWTREQVIAHQLNLGRGERKLFARLASSIIHADPRWRRHHNMTERQAGQSGLWKFGISGDLPIMIVRAGSLGHMPLVRSALNAHAYWRMHGIKVDLVIWNEEAAGYRQELNDRIMSLVGAGTNASLVDQPGGVYVRHVEHISLVDRQLLLGVARLVFHGERGSMAEQLPRETPHTAVVTRQKWRMADPSPALAVSRPLGQDNGCGGFSPDGREYVIRVEAGRETPKPWCNVLANPAFGCVVSERGAACSFAGNAREFRISPWYNDALLDTSGEAFYLRDDDRGTFWSPTPWPVPGGAAEARHGFGYSRHVMRREDIVSTQTVFVARHEPLKLTLVELHNDSMHTRHLSLFGYVEWVLGEQRAACAPHVRTRPGSNGRAIFAQNRYNDSFSARMGFFATSRVHSLSADRAAFVGRNRNMADPAGLHVAELDGATGGGLDPCAALQSRVALAPGERTTLVFILGAGDDAAHAERLVKQFVDVASAREELAGVQADWRDRLNRVVVETPDQATNLLINGWLAYQTIACRLWARSGFYQSGGAYGFRDQLQDCVSLLPYDTAYAREQILRAAAHQFGAGDVQHWWHPPHGRGVRTRFSDDFLWLPWALAQYLEASGDTRILDVEVPFLEGRELAPGEESWYDFAEEGASASVYEHARRALLHGLRFGEHGLPLIGCGDWNDGMNRLGLEGRGESVWLAFFLIDVLHRFAPVAERRDDRVLLQICHDEAEMLAARIEEHAWDGDWYRRAWADDGTVVGSADSEECRIDSLPQSWATLTGTGTRERRAQALDAVHDHLLRPEARLLQLFDPPFDQCELDPGYIKGYVPGIRENGGQYTHAAIWYAMACAHAGHTDRSWQIFHLLNPIKHAVDNDGVQRYQLEPYVIAADVYWNDACRGRGGWSWYTGSAGWMLRFALQSLVGMTVSADSLHLAPCLPADWPHCRVCYRHGADTYEIEIRRDQGGQTPGLWLDGAVVEGDSVSFVNDGGTHRIRLLLPQIGVESG